MGAMLSPPAEEAELANDPQARRAHRHDHAGMPAGARRCRPRHTHHDHEGASRMRSAGDVPFAAVDLPVAAVAAERGGDVGGVGRGDVGFGHAEGGAHAALEQRLEPTLLLFGRRGMLQHDHVGHVGRLAVEDLGRPWQASHDLGEGCVVAVAQSLRQAEVPQACQPRLGLQRGQERRRFAPGDVLHPIAMARQDFAVEKRLDGRAQIPSLNRHRHFIWLVSSAAAPPCSLPYFSSAARPPAA